MPGATLPPALLAGAANERGAEMRMVLTKGFQTTLQTPAVNQRLT